MCLGAKSISQVFLYAKFAEDMSQVCVASVYQVFISSMGCRILVHFYTCSCTYAHLYTCVSSCTYALHMLLVHMLISTPVCRPRVGGVQGINDNPYDEIVLTSQFPLTVGQTLSPPVASEKRIKVCACACACV